MTDLRKAAEDNRDRIAHAENAGEVVRCIFRTHEVVYGLIGDAADKFVIKGEWALKTDGASLRTTAMFCQDIEEAKALRNVFGDVVQT
ncbi:hypothetical protein [Bradyrhizobium prioriisuperbiae]|uniref:hypothetical protein n=1 Tax=Bradyrhizobium prioriisuperbiae TaxID=2854389 RepID=UPI0028E9EE40|nr:hypothetical protein [Bradyrhizobium prioritasuperba]